MKKVLFSLLIVVSIFLLTSCGSDGGSGSSSSMIGNYELSSLSGDNATYTGEEWKNMTNQTKKLVITKDQIEMHDTLTTDGKEESTVEYYTYDDTTLYGTDNEGTEEGKAYFTYEYSKGTIQLIVIDDDHNSTWTYKKTSR